MNKNIERLKIKINVESLNIVDSEREELDENRTITTESAKEIKVKEIKQQICIISDSFKRSEFNSNIQNLSNSSILIPEILEIKLPTPTPKIKIFTIQKDMTNKINKDLLKIKLLNNINNVSNISSQKSKTNDNNKTKQDAKTTEPTKKKKKSKSRMKLFFNEFKKSLNDMGDKIISNLNQPNISIQINSIKNSDELQLNNFTNYEKSLELDPITSIISKSLGFIKK